MAIIPFSKVGRMGLITDSPPHDLPLEAWSAAENVRFSRGRVERFHGHSPVLGTPTISPYTILPWSDSQELYTFYADGTAIYRTDGISHIDVSRAVGGAYTAGTYPRWNGGVLGGVPILNNTNFVDPPQMWNSATTKFADLSNWPAATACRVIRPYKQYLVALDITESGTRYPTRIMWSHPADPGTVPLSWDYTDDTKDAGTFSMSETTGFLVDCLPLGDVNIIYKEDSTWYMRHTGTEFIFQSGMLFRNQGMLTANCVAEFARRHFVVGLDDIWMHDGQTSQSLIEDKVKDYFFANLDPSFYVHTFVVSNPRREEIWVCYPETGNVWPNMALVWNWRYSTWTIRELKGNFAFGTYQMVESAPTDDTFEGSVGTTFDADSGTFGERSFTPTGGRILLAEPGAGKAFHLADTTEQWDGQTVTTFVERTGLTIAGVDKEGKPIVDQERVKFVRRVWPNIRADAGAIINVYVGKQDRIGADVIWTGPLYFDPSRDVKVDCTVSGRLIAVRFEVTTDHWWELEGYKLDLEVIGLH